MSINLIVESLCLQVLLAKLMNAIHANAYKYFPHKGKSFFIKDVHFLSFEFPV